jgi:23S rRNA (cytosine1962-C5)-methyltransferase
MLTNLPAPSGTRIAIRLHHPAERAVREGHPWVFESGIRMQRHEGRAGDLAVLFDHNNDFLAIGLYDPDSAIRVRVLHHGSPAVIDRDWFAASLRSAYERRAPIMETDTTGFRMVHGENDGLPGLIVDRYDNSLVVKLYTAAWFPWLNDVLAGLDALLPAERVVLRLGRSVQRVAAASGIDLQDGQLLHGEPLDGPVLFRENGLTFEADLVQGQKTGFFLDQRDNRRMLERFCEDRTVLNVFAYTGGFSVYAARGGARSVTSLDASAPALAAAERNFLHNAAVPEIAAARHRVLIGDAFELLPTVRRGGEEFDVVVLDPPSFAKSQAEVDRALHSYARIIRMGMNLLARDGLLVAASCSSRVSADQFRSIVERTARDARRPLEVLQQTGHALDHPVGFPEGEYLKCIFARLP